MMAGQIISHEDLIDKRKSKSLFADLDKLIKFSAFIFAEEDTSRILVWVNRRTGKREIYCDGMCLLTEGSVADKELAEEGYRLMQRAIAMFGRRN